MNCFIQIDYISPDALDFVKQHEDIQGVVLGDYTCNRRMFPGGYAGLVKSVGDFKRINKEIIIQTPMYATVRNFDEIVDGISFLNTEYQIKKFLVQDVGVLSSISKTIPDSELIWSQMGRNRGNILNMESVLYLQEQGLTGMELCTKSRISALSTYGMKAYASYGNIIYMSVSRNCYNKFFDDNTVCRNDCCNHRKTMTTKSENQISVDGFFLGKAYHYNDSCEYWQSVWNYCENIILHAESLETAIKYYNKYKEISKAYE
ncbi:MAG: hypothetical protein HFG82_13075 [Dorea sp.]|jgi:hypothetical protein|nr:hypothetical protein [Dorea sp.]